MAPSIIEGEYKKIPEHYNRNNWVNKRYWSRVTRPKIINKDTIPEYRGYGGVIKGGNAVDPYTNKKFDPKHGEVDHTVALKEAHESQVKGSMLSPAEKLKFGHNVANLKLIQKKTNREKSYHDIANWMGAENQVPYAKKIEQQKNRFGLAMDKEEATKFKKIVGRKTTTKIAPKLSKTLYCTRCHVDHSIGNHN